MSVSIILKHLDTLYFLNFECFRHFGVTSPDRLQCTAQIQLSRGKNRNKNSSSIEIQVAQEKESKLTSKWHLLLIFLSWFRVETFWKKILNLASTFLAETNCKKHLTYHHFQCNPDLVWVVTYSNALLTALVLNDKELRNLADTML